MTTFIRTFQVNAGVIAADKAPTTDEELYVSKDEMRQLFGCQPTDADLRAAQIVVNSFCNRASLWPTLCQTPALEIPNGRQETRLAVTPVIQITACAGKYAPGRRDRQGYNNLYSGLNPLLVLATTGAPVWQDIPVHTVEVDASTGCVYLPWSSMLVPYNFVRIGWIGGYLEIPSRVKMAMFELINTMHGRGMSDLTRSTVGRITRTWASRSFVTPFCEELLEPFVVRALL